MSEVLEPGGRRGGRARAPEAPGSLALLDAIDEGLLRVEDGHVAWANAAAARMAGLDRAEALVGRPAPALLEVEAEGRAPGPPPDAVVCGLRRPRAEALPVALRVLEAPAGGSFWLLREARGDDGDAGALAEALEKSRAEVAALGERLAREIRERDELLMVVSHELRTPVTVIAGFGKLLLSEQAGPLNPEQRRFLEESARSCRRLDAFIGSLIAGPRNGSEPARPCGREASLGDAIRGVVTFLAPLLDERELRVDLEIDEGADRAWFDREPIEQVLTNVLGNAQKYAPEGSRIRVATRPVRDGDRAFVRVEVSDSGPGIPEEHRERIFEPWVRVRPGEGAGGLGLGLAICRRIVEGHGGMIGVEPSRDGGSRFAFTVPVEGPAGDPPA